MMTETEVRKFIDDNPAVFYKVWAVAKPDQSRIIEHRFPGLSFTGYFIENAKTIRTFACWLNIEKMEKW